MAEKVELILQIRDQMSRELKQIDGRIAGLEKTSNKTDIAIGNLTKSLVGLAGSFVTFQAISGAISQAEKFEQGIIGVEKTTGLAGKQLKLLEDDIYTLGVTLKGVKTEELLSIAQTAGQLGIKGSENITSFTETIAKVGVATDLTAEQAATSFAKLQNVLGLTTDDLGRLGSVFNEVSNNSTALVSDLVAFTQRIAGAGKTIGLTYDQIIGLSGALQDTGNNFEVGGSAVSRALQLMLTDTEKFADVSGVSFDEFSRMLNEKPIEAVKAFLNQLSKLDKVARLQALEQVGLTGIEASGTFLKLAEGIDAVDKNLKTANDEFERGTSLQTEYDAASRSSIASTERMYNAFNQLEASATAAFLPIKKDAADAATNLLNALRVDSETQNFAKFLATTGGLLIAGKTATIAYTSVMASYNAAIEAATARTSIYNVATNMTTVTTSKATLATLALNSAVKASPMAIAVGVAASLSAAYVALTDDTDDLAKSTLEAAKNQERLTEAQRNVAISEAKKQLKELRAELSKTYTDVRSFGSDEGLIITDKERVRLDEIKGKIKELAGTLRELEAPIKSGLNQALEDAKEKADENTVSVYNWAKAIDQAGKKLKDTLSQLESGSKFDLVVDVGSTFDNIAGEIRKGSVLGKALERVMKEASEKGTFDGTQAGLEKITEEANRVAGFANGVGNAVEGAVTDAVIQGLEGDFDPQSILSGLGRSLVALGLAFELQIATSVSKGVAEGTAAGASGVGAIAIGAGLIGLSGSGLFGGGGGGKSQADIWLERQTSILEQIRDNTDKLSEFDLTGTALQTSLSSLGDVIGRRFVVDLNRFAGSSGYENISIEELLAMTQEQRLITGSDGTISGPVELGGGEYISEAGSALSQFQDVIYAIGDASGDTSLKLQNATNALKSANIGFNGTEESYNSITQTVKGYNSELYSLQQSLKAQIKAEGEASTEAEKNAAQLEQLKIAKQIEDFTDANDELLTGILDNYDAFKLLGDEFSSAAGGADKLRDSIMSFSDIAAQQQSFLDKNLSLVESGSDSVERLMARVHEQDTAVDELRSSIQADVDAGLIVDASRYAQLRTEESGLLGLAQMAIDKNTETYASTQTAQDNTNEILALIDDNQNKNLSLQEELLNINNTILGEVRDAIFAQNAIMSEVVATI